MAVLAVLFHTVVGGLLLAAGLDISFLDGWAIAGGLYYVITGALAIALSPHQGAHGGDRR